MSGFLRPSDRRCRSGSLGNRHNLNTMPIGGSDGVVPRRKTYHKIRLAFFRHGTRRHSGLETDKQSPLGGHHCFHNRRAGFPANFQESILQTLRGNRNSFCVKRGKNKFGYLGYEIFKPNNCFLSGGTNSYKWSICHHGSRPPQTTFTK